MSILNNKIMCKDCEFCKLTKEIEKYLDGFFEKIPDEDKAAVAGFIMGHVALIGSDNYMESLGIFEIAKEEYKESYKEATNDNDKLIKMN